MQNFTACVMLLKFICNIQFITVQQVNEQREPSHTVWTQYSEYVVYNFTAYQDHK